VQILVKTQSGRTIVLEVEPGDTIARVKQKAAKKANDGIPVESFELILPPRTVLEDNKTVGDYNIKAGTNLGTKYIPPPPSYDQDVLPLLISLLEELQNESGAFIFIGIGCYDHSHGHESIRQQQCPVAVFKECEVGKLKLRVILIDPDFSETTYDQIYDIDKNWQLTSEKQEGKYKVYQYQSKDFKLYTFATCVPESVYGGQDKTLANYDLEKLGAQAGSKGSTLLVGNFYAKDNPPHVAMGDVTLLSQLGYIKK
jgi:ubiquitin-large subunit ribosomal protein L40e